MYSVTIDSRVLPPKIPPATSIADVNHESGKCKGHAPLQLDLLAKHDMWYRDVTLRRSMHLITRSGKKFHAQLHIMQVV